MKLTKFCNLIFCSIYNFVACSGTVCNRLFHFRRTEYNTAYLIHVMLMYRLSLTTGLEFIV